MIQLNIPKDHQAGVCAADEDRHFSYSTALVYSSGDNCYVAATDGKVLSVLPVKVTNKPEKPVKVKPDNLKSNCVAEEITDGLCWPSFKDVFPAPDKLKDYHTVTIDAKLLLRLTKAVSDNSRLVTLHVHKRSSEKPLLVFGVDGDNPPGVGMLMPCTSPTDRSEHYAKCYADMPSYEALKGAA